MKRIIVTFVFLIPAISCTDEPPVNSDTESNIDTESTDQTGFYRGWCTMACDRGDDGSVVLTAEMVYPKAGGKMTRSFSSRDLETGSMNSMTFDEMGRQECRGYLDAEGNEYELCEVYTYDANGCVTGVERTVFDGVSTVTSIPDTRFDCAITANGIVQTEWRDVDGDGVEDRTDVYEYDALHFLVSESHDENLDGVFELRMRTVRDNHYNVLKMEAELNGDGRSVEILTATYTEDDRSLTTQMDNDYDGVMDDVFLWIYDDIGRELRCEKTVTGDDSVPVNYVYSEVTEYDPAGNPTAMQTDEDADGTFDTICRLSYECWND